MRFHLLLLALILTCQSGFAQTTDSTFVKKKNTLAFAGLPLHIFFIGEATNRQRYNLSYKREGKKLNFRSSFNYLLKNRDIFWIYEEDIITTSNDSVWRRRTNMDIQRSEIDVRVGLEKNLSTNRSSWILGLDLRFGYYDSQTSINQSYIPESANNEIYQPFLSNTNSEQTTYNHFIYGLSPVVGWSYQINKVFGVSIEYRPTINYLTSGSAIEYNQVRFDDGVTLESPNTSSTSLEYSINDIRTDMSGLDLFLTVNF